MFLKITYGVIYAPLLSIGLMVCVALVVNGVTFVSRFANALLKALLQVAIICGIELARRYSEFATNPSLPSNSFIPVWIANLVEAIIINAGVIFAIALIANFIKFDSRFLNAYVTALIYTAVYAILWYGLRHSILLKPILGDLFF